MYKTSGNYAANALIRFIDTKAVALPGALVHADSIYTDSLGQYTLDSLPDGQYNTFGEKDGKLYFRSHIQIKNGTTLFDTLRDTLKTAGSLCCVVKHRYHDDSRYIICLLPGTNRFLQSVDSSGTFCLNNFPQGTFQVQFLSALPYYTLIDTTLVIRAGIDDTLADTMCLEYGGIPEIAGFSVYYDNRSNNVTVSWNRMDSLLVPAYNIYKAEQGQELTLLTPSPVTDTLFTDSTLKLWTTYNYCVAGSRNGEEGPPCGIKSVHTTFKPQGWYKGQLHCHTTNSDGLLPVSEVIRKYRLEGYDFVAVSDHNQLTNTNIYNDTNFVTIPNDELTFGIKHVNAIKAIKPYTGIIPEPVYLQDVLDAAISIGAMPHINHPHSSQHTPEDIVNATGVSLLEIVNFRYDDPVYNCALWDRVLSMGRDIYGTAGDDAHNYITDFNTGWIMVKASLLSPSNILLALENGEFYATSGPIITTITTEERTLTIDSEDGITIDFIGKNGGVLATVDSNAASYTLPAGGLYVRAQVTNSRGKIAYTQAYFP